MAILTRAEYRRLSGDEDSYDGDVDVALVEVQIEVERITGRKFERGTYTERIPYYGTKIYPSAVPVASVASPSGTTIDGFGLELGYAGAAWRFDGFEDSVEITYTGGYEEEDMPIELKRLVARIVKRLVTTDALDFELPHGVTSVSVGPVSISGKGLSAVDVMDSALAKELRRWRKPEV